MGFGDNGLPINAFDVPATDGVFFLCSLAFIPFSFDDLGVSGKFPFRSLSILATLAYEGRVSFFCCVIVSCIESTDDFKDSIVFVLISNFRDNFSIRFCVVHFSVAEVTDDCNNPADGILDASCDSIVR